MRMTFLGAAGTVTGSKYLLEHRDQHVLIDCGLFQGYKQLRLHNWEAFQLPVHDLDAIVLTTLISITAATCRCWCAMAIAGRSTPRPRPANW